MAAVENVTRTPASPVVERVSAGRYEKYSMKSPCELLMTGSGDRMSRCECCPPTAAYAVTFDVMSTSPRNMPYWVFELA
ncbi:hypothetical protein D3C71_1552760 [compost metagenome]